MEQAGGSEGEYRRLELPSEPVFETRCPGLLAQNFKTISRIISKPFYTNNFSMDRRKNDGFSWIVPSVRVGLRLLKSISKVNGMLLTLPN